MSPLPGGQRILDRYTIYDEIASGGMARVHLGKLEGAAGFSRIVAVKRLHPRFSDEPEFIAMLLDEARLAARILHPNVVSTLDVVSDRGELCLVMDYVPGDSLARLLKETKRSGERVPVELAVSIIVGVLHGLHAAHEAMSETGEALGIVHRDVSPQNVLVGVDGVARVLDFGIAHARGRLQTTGEGQLKGKLRYMASEQLRGRPVSRRTDIYAASVVLWEMLVGEPLFGADSEAGVFGKVLEGVVPPPSRFRAGVHGLDAIVLQGLSRDASERFASARDMALSLEQAMRPASLLEVGAWVRRTAGPLLARRARLVAEIEGRSPASARELMLAGEPAGERSSTQTRPGQIHEEASISSAHTLAHPEDVEVASKPEPGLVRGVARDAGSAAFAESWVVRRPSTLRLPATIAVSLVVAGLLAFFWMTREGPVAKGPLSPEMDHPAAVEPAPVVPVERGQLAPAVSSVAAVQVSSSASPPSAPALPRPVKRTSPPAHGVNKSATKGRDPLGSSH